MGEVAMSADFDEVVTGAPWSREWASYVKTRDVEVEAVRADLLRITPVAAQRFHALDDPLRRVGARLASLHGLGIPTAAIAHRDLAIPYHADHLNPYPCMNLTLFFRSECDGGLLVLRDRRVAFACDDLTAIVFDGQEQHGVTAVEPRARGGYRLSLTFYCPRSAAEEPVDEQDRDGDA